MPALIPFHEVRFPTAIAFGASGGPERRTEIVTLGSGHEERNTRWADSRRRYNAGYGIRSLDDLHAVIAFFEERRGRLYGFRWRDRVDCKSCAPGGRDADGPDDRHRRRRDGRFQLVKPTARSRALGPDDPEAGGGHGAGRGRWRREGRGRDWSVDLATGLVTFAGGAIPARARWSRPASSSTCRCASTPTASTSTSPASPPATFRRSRWWEIRCEVGEGGACPP